jgi:hypothetical protein
MYEYVVRCTVNDLVEARILPDQQKLDLCLELLQEFGAGSVTKHGYELTHKCTLGLGGHSDHNSKTASVNYKKLEFNCFVCGNGGSLAWWIAVNRRTDTNEIEPWLRQKLGIGSSLPLGDLLNLIDSICHPKHESQRMPVFNEKILERWTNWEDFHPYLTEVRKIPRENLERFNVGYADTDDDFHYSQRIILPIHLPDKTLVGWQARALLPEPEKYKNSPGLPRDRILYGDTDARKVVLVESPMSVLRQSSRRRPVVASFGSNLTEAQLRLLQRYEEVTVFCENDKAGLKMIRRAINGLSRYTRVSVVVNPYVKEIDPADLDEDTFIKLVDSAVPGAIWAPKRYSELAKYN